MTSSNEGIADALRRAGVADVDTSPRRRVEYSADASLYRVVPAAVAFPRTADEVVAVVEVCRTLGVPVTARGSGTSLAGNAVGTGVVMDVRRHLDRVVDIDPEARTAVVEPGVVLDRLQHTAGRFALRFGPDPSTHDRCTLGGMIGNNACGSRALGYGRTVDHVLALDAVTGRGERLSVGQGEAGAGSRRLSAGIDDLLYAYGGDIRSELGRFSRQISGYPLHHLLPEHGRDVAKALVGTEGTCASVVGATLSLVDAPPATVLVVLGYPDMASAADAVPALLPHGAMAMEGMDARIVDVVHARRGADAVPPLPRGEAWLFAELAGGSMSELRDDADRLAADAEALEHRVVADPVAVRALWRIREDGSGLVARAGARPAHAGWEDAAVPPERLGSYLRDFERLLAEHRLTGVPYGHFGDGCVHVRIDFPFGDPGGRDAFRRFLVDGARLVVSYGGSLSGEHGDGRARSELLHEMYPDAVLAAFGAFKAVWDPDDVLNPGVVVRPAPLDADLRVGTRPRTIPAGSGFRYEQDGGDFSTAVHRCTGIGRCVSGDMPSGKVMCPSYAATGDERDSTRGRARVLQEMMAGELLEDGWRAAEVHEALDLCLACKGCASDCPTSVDMATYKAEVLHHTYRRRLRPRSHYTLGWLPRWARLASRSPRLVSRLLAAPRAVRLMQRIAGIDPRRPLPAFAEETLRAWFDARDDAPPDAATRPQVVLWADTFTDRFAPHVGIAAVRVLEDAGLGVRLSPPGLCCSLTWITTGQLAAAGRMLRHTVDTLASDARSGIPIVGLEPSCTAVLRADALELLGHDDDAARDVAAATRTLAEVLASRRPEWKPPSLEGLRIVAQPHCHHHAIMGWEADRALLIGGGADLIDVGGCCGLAGNFGVEEGHYDVSVAVAETTLLPAVRAGGADALVLADGFSCRTQLDHLAGRRGLHLAELLADRVGSRASVPYPPV